MSRALLPILLSLGACGGRSDAPPVAPVGPAGAAAQVAPPPPAAVVGTVSRRGTDERKPPEVHLVRAADGARWSVKAPEGEFAFTDLEPGAYVVSLELPIAMNGPWLFDHHEVEVGPERGARVAFDAPAATGTLRLRTDRDTPPFVLFLVRPGAPTPETMSELGRMWDDDVPHPDILFTYMDDGRGPFDDVPPIPAGEYSVVICANDWEDGDPTPRPRTWTMELPHGGRRTLRMRERLTVLEIR